MKPDTFYALEPSFEIHNDTLAKLEKGLREAASLIHEVRTWLPDDAVVVGFQFTPEVSK